MTAAMGVVRLPVTVDAMTVRGMLLDRGTDAPVHALEGGLWLRLSAFAYNEIEDYVRLAEIVAEVVA